MLALVSESRLFVNGLLPQGAAVGIVGARGATRSGLGKATALAQGLAAQGVAVVSGGARGVDAAAHRGALAAAGATVVVLGHGLDVIYPPEHGALFAEVVARGGALVTPFAAGTPPAGWRFRARNQIIAALGQALVVVEAGTVSGSLSTARAARALGRPVLAMPGSPGTDRLLETGAATLCDDVADVLAALAGQTRKLEQDAPHWGSDEAALLAVLVPERALAADEVAALAGLDLDGVLAGLCELELSGLALRDATGRWLRSRIEVT